MSHVFTDAELAAYLDESLVAEQMIRIESALRIHPELVDRLIHINRRRDRGQHTLGDIWRRNRISCPAREQLGSFLLGVLEKDEADYIEFHLFEVGCRLCQANAEDLQMQRDRSTKQDAEVRRRKYFQTSAGLLSRPEDD